MTLPSRQWVRRPALQPALPGIDPVLARLYASRNIGSLEDLGSTVDRLIPPDQLMGIESAVDLLVDALERQQRILIVADFDADGATSCALAVRGFRAMGARDVRYVVPNRFEYGYGLTPEIVELASQQDPDIIVTVDNGTSSHAGVAAARQRGIRVLITDHHLPGPQLPDADAIVNPNQTGDPFPSKNLAGVGVVFYVLLALRSRLRASGWFVAQSIEEPNLARYLDLVALGTVADVVPLDRNNRTLVAQGLARINRRQCSAGVLALLQVGGRQAGRLVATDLGFVVGPRLNAAGRLTDMSLGIECLLTDDWTRAASLAGELDRLNRERRTIESEMQSQATEAVARLDLEHGGLPAGLCLFDPDWHQGVIGILAARVRERVHRPVIAFAPTGQPGVIKGSARSVPGLHVRDALDAVATRHPGLIDKFGGHAMAAGLSLTLPQLPAFGRAFATEVMRQLGEHGLRPVIETDGELSPGELTLTLARAIRLGGPWGQGFPEPVFDGEFAVLARRVVADRHLKMILRPASAAIRVNAIAFGVIESRDPLPDWPRIRIAYRLDVNDYQGQESLQLIVEHMEQAGVLAGHTLESANASPDP